MLKELLNHYKEKKEISKSEFVELEKILLSKVLIKLNKRGNEHVGSNKNKNGS